MKHCAYNRAFALVGLIAVPFVSSCASELDMQGHDPQVYYTENPVVNKLENKNSLLLVEFESKDSSLPADKSALLRDSLKLINPDAVDAVTIRVPAHMANKHSRVASVGKIIRDSGIVNSQTVMSDPHMVGQDLLVDIAYVAVISPDCPDWRKSPVTTFSNTVASNFGCATTTNLGLMVKDPRDLVRGKEGNVTHSERGSKVVSDYNSNVEAAPAAAP